MTGGEVKGIAADKKEMLVARAIASPKVLMLSGAGERECTPQSSNSGH